MAGSIADHQCVVRLDAKLVQRNLEALRVGLWTPCSNDSMKLSTRNDVFLCDGSFLSVLTAIYDAESNGPSTRYVGCATSVTILQFGVWDSHMRPGPVWIDLPEPRSLKAAERAVLDALIHHAGCRELTDQAVSARVVGKCRCGCSSVHLQTAGPPVPPSTIAARSTTARDDYLGVEAEGTTPGGQAVDATVHICSGMLEELEVFAGEGVATGLPSPDSWRAIALI
jgi:hypothetical protein